MNNRSGVTFFLITLSLSTSGCFFAGGGQNQETEAYVAEEHLHHELPEHMPHDFPDAVREMRNRDRELRETHEAGETEEAQQMLSDILDILGWMPQLAADSDLLKQEWEQVRDGVSQLEQHYRQIQKTDAVQTFSENRKSQVDVAAILDRFQTLCEKYPDGFEPVLGEHEEHDHHDH